MERKFSLEQRTERLMQRRWESSPASSAPRDPQAPLGGPSLLPRSLSVVLGSECSPDPQMPPQTSKRLPNPSFAPVRPRHASGTLSYPTRSQVMPQTHHCAHKCVPQPLKLRPRPPVPRAQYRVSISGVLAPPQPSPPPTSQALLRPGPRGPEGAKALLGSALCSSTLDDPLVQWRLGRCRGKEPALDTPLVGRALLGSAAPRGSLQGVLPGRSRDPPEAPWPIGRHFCKHQGASSPQAGSQEPLWQDPCWRPPDSRKTLWPLRSSSLDTLQGALYSQSRDSHHALRQISSSCCAPLHQGVPPGKRDSHEPLLQEPLWGSHDCLGALWCAPYWKSRGSQDALGPAREALPEPLPQGGPGFRSHDPREAPQPIRNSARDAPQEAPWQQPLAPPGPLGDPLLWMLRCHRRAIRGCLRAIETLLECPPGHPQPMVGPIKQ
ncbi:uncharacterized protein LOC134434281 [Melospiza melodia melodia]|uniref:uncharacterized protein LOC134434281 n=1 Tax=Melospiza melodia melodia TaxID=1914991 RepID=UPI002FD3A4A6